MITLNLPQDYTWPKLLKLYNDSHCLEPTERSDPKKGVLEGIVELPNPFWYRLEQNDSTLALSLTAPDGSSKPSKKDYSTARAWAIRRFWLELDMEAMREALEVNFLGYSLANEFWPVMSPCYTGYWASLLRIYCGRKFDKVLRAELGSRVVFEGKEYALLPSPEQMLEVSSQQLKTIGLSAWSSRKLPHITQAFLGDPELGLDQLPPDPLEALRLIHKRFELGGTSAAWVLMRGAIRADVALEGHHIRRALAEGLGLDATPRVKEYNELMQIHAPYRSFASYYLHLSALKQWRKNWSLED
jgi:hypothetical protein